MENFVLAIGPSRPPPYSVIGALSGATLRTNTVLWYAVLAYGASSSPSSVLLLTPRRRRHHPCHRGRGSSSVGLLLNESHKREKENQTPIWIKDSTPYNNSPPPPTHRERIWGLLWKAKNVCDDPFEKPVSQLLFVCGGVRSLLTTIFFFLSLMFPPLPLDMISTSRRPQSVIIVSCRSR